MAGGIDLANLSLNVDSSGVDAASVSLDRLDASAGRAGIGVANIAQRFNAAQLAAAAAGVAALRATPQVERLGRQMQLTGQQAQFLSYQINDIVTSIGSGMNPMQILAQQGGQVYQALSMGPGGVGGSLRAIGSTMMNLLTPARVLAGGLAAIGVAGATAALSWRGAQNDIRAALSGIGAASGATVSDINNVTSSIAASTNITVGTARQMATEFARARVPVGLLNDAILLTRDYAKQLGLDTEAATEVMARAMADPTRGAETLNEALGRIDDRTRLYIRTLQEQGNRQAAVQALQDATRNALINTTREVNVLSTAWDKMMNLASRAWSGLGYGVNRLLGGGTNEELLADAQRQLENLRRQREAFGGLADYLVPGTNQRSLEQEQKLEARIRELQQRIEAAAQAATDTLNTELADKASAIVRGVISDLERLSGLNNQIQALQKARQDPAVLERMGVSAEAVDEAIARLTSRLENFQSAVDQMREDQELEIRRIQARTVQDQAQVEADEALSRARRQGLTELEQSVAAEGARNRVLAQANEQAREAARIAREQASLASLRPFERAMRENQYRDEERRRTMGIGSGTGGVISTPVPPVGSGALVPMPHQSFGLTSGATTEMGRIVAAAAETARQLGVSAKDLLTIVSYETAGTMNPTKAGPRTQWGQHRGLIQWGEPQAQKYLGGDFSIENQFRGMIKYFQDAGVRPGMGLMDLYSAVNAGRVGRYNASDANNGGAPGTVADKVNYQMSGHRARADRLLSTGGMAQQTIVPNYRDPVQVPGTANSDLDETARLERQATMWQYIEGPLRDANDQLEAQNALNARNAETWGRSTLEMTRASEAQRLLNQYTQAGVTAATIGQEAYSQLVARIGDYAQRAGEAAQAQEDLARRQELVVGMNDALRDGFSGFISDLRAGKDASEALANALNRVLDNILNMVINQAFSFGGQQGGLFGAIFSWLGGGLGAAPVAGRANGGPMFAGVPMLVGEHGPEVFTPSTAGHVTPNGGGVNIQVIEGNGTQATVTQRDDGTIQIDTAVRTVETKIADRINRNRGPVAKATKSSMSRGNLRG